MAYVIIRTTGGEVRISLVHDSGRWTGRSDVIVDVDGAAIEWPYHIEVSERKDLPRLPGYLQMEPYQR